MPTHYGQMAMIDWR